VEEAIRRRKAEKITQKEHAALASVSIPTMIAFDRRERTLSLAKAIDILRVVGLVQEPAEETSQEIFVGEAFARWRELTKALPKEEWRGIFSHGWYRIDYVLDGDIKDIELHKFPNVLRQAVVSHTGWPMFWLPRRPEYSAYEVDGVIESWLPPSDDRPFSSEPAHCDFWRAAPNGRMILIRGYQEDGQEALNPGTVFDTTLPIWRVAEAFLHAARLAKLIARNPDSTTIRLRVLYTGLQGRDLRAWASPMSAHYFEGGRSRTDEAMLERTALVASIETELSQQVYPLIASLYERFGVTGISENFVTSTIGRMKANWFGDHTATTG
jgi:transcriptional regulator with XRE-family HTH domain